MAPALAMRNVRFAWPGRSSFALSVPHFALEQDETVLLLGESGSGKSTLLSLICGIVRPSEGEIRVGNTDLSTLGASRRDRLRGEDIGIIFQQFNLLPHLSVRDNILLPLSFAPRRRRRAGDGGAEAERLAAALGLSTGLIDTRADQLSVGQQQRVAAARALIGTPPLIIADEPTSSLDGPNQSAFLDLMFDQIARNGTTLLLVSHDDRLAPRFDRVCRIAEVVNSERLP